MSEDMNTPAAEVASEPEWLQEVKRLALAGDKIRAIQLYHRSTTTGLYAAKDSIEAIIAARPTYEQLEAENTRLQAQLAEITLEARANGEAANQWHKLADGHQERAEKAEADAGAMRAIINNDLVGYYREQADPNSEEHSGAHPGVRRRLVQEAKDWLQTWEANTAGNALLAEHTDLLRYKAFCESCIRNSESLDETFEQFVAHFRRVEEALKAASVTGATGGDA